MPELARFLETSRTSLPDGSLWVKRSRSGLRHLLEFEDLAAFLIDLPNREILACPRAGTALAGVRHLLLNQVLPLYLSALNRLVLHASAVAVGGQAIAFMGDAGRGKSTLARSLLESGCQLITDDMLLLAGDAVPSAVPSYPGLRLWPDSLAALGQGPFDLIKGGNMLKQRLGAAALPLPAQPVPLARIYLLSEPSDQPAIRPVLPVKALTALLRANFMLELDSPECLARQFQRLSRLAALPLFFALSYPHDFRMLPRVRDLILEHTSQAIAV